MLGYFVRINLFFGFDVIVIVFLEIMSKVSIDVCSLFILLIIDSNY